MQDPISVLIIEDDFVDAEYIRLLLDEGQRRRVSFEHVTTLSGAMQRMKRREFNLALLDLGLPDALGLEGLDKLMMHHPKVPVVVLTGLAQDETAVLAVQKGAQDYLVKGSFGPELFVKSMRYAIERHRIQAELRQANLKLRMLARQLSDANEELEEENRQLEWTNQRLHERMHEDLISFSG